MELNKIEKVPVLVIGYDLVKDYRQFKIAVLKSVNLNLVSKLYYVGKDTFVSEMERFCEEFKVLCEQIKILPAKLSNEQVEKLSEIKSVVIFNNGEDKSIKRYETFAKKLPIYINIWKLKDGNLVHK